MIDAPLDPPKDKRVAEPDMTDAQVRIWISACNHEPARRVLRTYLMMKEAGFDVDGVAKMRLENLTLRKALKPFAEAEAKLKEGRDVVNLYVADGLPGAKIEYTAFQSAANTLSSHERPKP